MIAAGQVEGRLAAAAAAAAVVVPPVDGLGVVSMGEVAGGASCVVVAVLGAAGRRLREMGFCEGAEVEVLVRGRNLVCSVCGTRLALSRALAAQVKVVLRPARTAGEA